MEPTATAIQQRETLAKGSAGEFLAMDFFDRYGVPYLHMEQSKHTYSKALYEAGGKRPDFMIWDPNAPAKSYLVDLKNIDVYQNLKAVPIGNEEYKKLVKTELYLGMPLLMGFVLQRKFLFFLRLDQLLPVDRRYHAVAERGPDRPNRALWPDWYIKDAIVSWEHGDEQNLLLNKDFDFTRLFATPPTQGVPASASGASPPTAAGV